MANNNRAYRSIDYRAHRAQAAESIKINNGVDKLDTVGQQIQTAGANLQDTINRNNILASQQQKVADALLIENQRFSLDQAVKRQKADLEGKRRIGQAGIEAAKMEAQWEDTRRSLAAQTEVNANNLALELKKNENDSLTAFGKAAIGLSSTLWEKEAERRNELEERRRALHYVEQFFGPDNTLEHEARLEQLRASKLQQQAEVEQEALKLEKAGFQDQADQLRRRFMPHINAAYGGEGIAQAASIGLQGRLEDSVHRWRAIAGPEGSMRDLEEFLLNELEVDLIKQGITDGEGVESIYVLKHILPAAEQAIKTITAREGRSTGKFGYEKRLQIAINHPSYDSKSWMSNPTALAQDISQLEIATVSSSKSEKERALTDTITNIYAHTGDPAAVAIFMAGLEASPMNIYAKDAREEADKLITAHYDAKEEEINEANEELITEIDVEVAEFMASPASRNEETLWKFQENYLGKLRLIPNNTTGWLSSHDNITAMRVSDGLATERLFQQVNIAETTRDKLAGLQAIINGNGDAKSKEKAQNLYNSLDPLETEPYKAVTEGYRQTIIKNVEGSTFTSPFLLPTIKKEERDRRLATFDAAVQQLMIDNATPSPEELNALIKERTELYVADDPGYISLYNLPPTIATLERTIELEIPGTGAKRRVANGIPVRKELLSGEFGKFPSELVIALTKEEVETAIKAYEGGNLHEMPPIVMKFIPQTERGNIKTFIEEQARLWGYGGNLEDPKVAQASPNVPTERLTIDRAYNYLKLKGVNEGASIAIAEGFMSESSGDTTDTSGDDGAARGGLQWQGGRDQRLMDFAKSKGKPWQDPEVQMDFVLYETMNYYPGVYAVFTARNPTANQLYLAMKDYLRWNDKWNTERKKSLNRALSNYGYK